MRHNCHYISLFVADCSNIVNCSINLNLSNSTQLTVANTTNTTATNLANNTLIYNNISLQDINGTGSNSVGYLWNVLCYDAAGQSTWGGTTNRTLFVDSVAPPALLNLTGAITANATVTSNLSPSFNWSITADMNFKNYTLEIYNSSERSPANMTRAYAVLGNNTNASFNLPVALVANLAYYWRVVIWDKAGWFTASTNNFTSTTDTQAPTLSITSPANVWVNVSTISFNYTGTDISLRNCTVYIGNTTNAASFAANKTNSTSVQNAGDLVSGTMISTNISLPDTNGTNFFWNVLCTDGAGQSTWGNTTGNLTVRVDSTAPSAFDSNLPVNFTVSNNQTPTLVWNMTTEPNLKNYTIEISGDSTFAANGSNYTYIATNATSNRTLLVTTSLAEGMWYWRVTAYDNAGWRTPMTNTSFWYEVDTTAPSGFAFVQSNNNWAVSYALNFSYRANDTRLIKNCSLWINNTGTFAQNVTNTTSMQNNSIYNFNVTIPSTQGIMFKWNVICSDNVGNTAWLQSTNFTTTVDTLAPNITSSTNGTTSSSKILTFTVNDTPSAVNITSLTITGVPSAFNNTRDCTASSGNISVTCTYTETGLASGTNVLTVTARDLAGKMTTYDLTVNTAAGTQNYTIPLVSGWNLISTPLILTNSSITNVVGSGTDVKQIWYYNGTGWQGWAQSGVISSLTTMEPRKGYWVNSTAATTLNFVGKLGSGNPEVAYDSMSLSASTWYTLGSYSFEGAVNKSVDNLLSNLCTQQCSSGSSTNSFSLLYYYNGTNMQVARSSTVLNYSSDAIGSSGRGFWIYMTSAGTYT